LSQHVCQRCRGLNAMSPKCKISALPDAQERRRRNPAGNPPMSQLNRTRHAFSGLFIYSSSSLRPNLRPLLSVFKTPPAISASNKYKLFVTFRFLVCPLSLSSPRQSLQKLGVAYKEQSVVRISEQIGDFLSISNVLRNITLFSRTPLTRSIIGWNIR
jgi:hypothetical protein